jgi:glycerol-3-phosphate cytidylyltransferase
MFHEGHYRLLERAKALGDYLIVGVTTEQYDESRGKLNVVDSLIERIDNVRGTGFADEIVIEDHMGQKVDDILRHNVDVFTLGSEWTGIFDYLRSYCDVVYLERTKDIPDTERGARKHKILKVGVIGSGRIASRFIPEAKYVSGANIEGVYNPRKKSAEDFAGRFELGFASSDLNDFFNSVDAVYVASPHDTHFEYTMAALRAGKHVLCEKPMFLRKSEAQSAFAFAEENKLVLMEGIKTAYCPGFSKLLGVVRSGEIGEVKDVEACFTKLVPVDSREWDVANGGAFLELASYPLFAIAKIMGTDYADVRFESLRDENGVDYYTKAYFEYENAFASLKVGIGVKSEGEMIISGTGAYIVVQAPWWKTQGFELRGEDPNRSEPFFTKYPGDGLRYELSDFLSAVSGNEKTGRKLTAAESVFVADIMEQFVQNTRCRG